MQLIAISMDQPSKLRETMLKDKLHYTLLSDSDANAVKAFGTREVSVKRWRVTSSPCECSINAAR